MRITKLPLLIIIIKKDCWPNQTHDLHCHHWATLTSLFHQNPLQMYGVWCLFNLEGTPFFQISGNIQPLCFSGQCPVPRAFSSTFTFFFVGFSSLVFYLSVRTFLHCKVSKAPSKLATNQKWLIVSGSRKERKWLVARDKGGPPPPPRKNCWLQFNIINGSLIFFVVVRCASRWGFCLTRPWRFVLSKGSIHGFSSDAL